MTSRKDINPKHLKVLELYEGGESATSAYKQLYPNASHQVAKNEGNRIVNRYWSTIEEDLSKLGIKREEIIDYWHKMMYDEKIPHKVRLMASQNIAKWIDRIDKQREERGKNPESPEDQDYQALGYIQNSTITSKK